MQLTLHRLSFSLAVFKKKHNLLKPMLNCSLNRFKIHFDFIRDFLNGLQVLHNLPNEGGIRSLLLCEKNQFRNRQKRCCLGFFKCLKQHFFRHNNGNSPTTVIDNIQRIALILQKLETGFIQACFRAGKTLYVFMRDKELCGIHVGELLPVESHFYQRLEKIMDVSLLPFSSSSVYLFVHETGHRKNVQTPPSSLPALLFSLFFRYNSSRLIPLFSQ